MLEVIRTTYRNNVFVPQTLIDLPNETEIEIVIQKTESKTKDDLKLAQNEEVQKKVMAKFIQRVNLRTIARDAPSKFTREELHERR